MNIYDTDMICTHLYSLHPSGLHQLQVQDARGIKGFHLRSCDSWGLGKVFLCNVESEIRGAKMWNIMNALKHIETMLFWEATTTAIIQIRLECIVKKPQELNCSHMRNTSKEAVSWWLSAHTCDAMNLPSKLLNSNSFAATRRVKHLQPLCRNLWDAGQLMWLDGLKSCTPSTTMNQYVIYSLTLKIRRNCRNWIIRHDPFPLQLVPVCASTTIFIGLESQPSRGFPRHVPTSGPFPFRSRISLRLSSNKGRFLYIAWRAGTSDRKTCSYSAHVSPKGIRTSNWLWLSVASTSGWTMLEALLRIPQEFVFVHSNVSTDAFTLYRRLAGHVGEVIKEACVIKILIWHAHFLKSPEAFAGPAGFGSLR